MNKGMRVVVIIGRLVVLIARLVLLLPAAWYHRQRGVLAFDRALRRHGVPGDSRRVLRLGYRAMVPLNPLQYRPQKRIKPRRGHRTEVSCGGPRPEAVRRKKGTGAWQARHHRHKGEPAAHVRWAGAPPVTGGRNRGMGGNIM